MEPKKDLPKQRREEADYADRVCDADGDAPERDEGYEACYADGSLKNECWNSRRDER